MMKKIMVIALMLSATIGASAQLLYKISGNGLAKPSYVVGTHHFGSITMVNNIKGVYPALTETDQVYGELILSDAAKMDSVKYLQNAMTLPDGKTLKDHLTTDEYTRLNKWLRAAMGNDLNGNTQMTQQMARMTPMALINNIQILLFATHGIGRVDPTTSLDNFFQEQGKHNNEPIGGLE